MPDCCSQYWRDRQDEFRSQLCDEMSALSESAIDHLHEGNVDAAKVDANQLVAIERILEEFRSVFKHAICEHER